MQSVRDRLILFLDYKNLSQKKFSEMTGLSNGFVNNIRVSIQPKTLEKISSVFPELNKSWLLTGEGEMLNDAPVAKISYKNGVPFYDVDFLLGYDELYAPDSVNPICFIQMPGYERATLWCKASGHSMEPEINNGDVIALQEIVDFSFLPLGEVYAFLTVNNQRTIKRIGKGSEKDSYRLIPTNKNYDEQDLPFDKILRVYRVMGTMKSF